MVAPGVAGGDHGRGLAVADRLGGPHERGVLHLAHARPPGRRPSRSPRRPAGPRGRRPGARAPRAGPTSRTATPSSATARWAPATISSGALSPPIASSATGSIAQAQSTSMAWRPAYQPQFPHTTWGTLVAPQRGHRLRERAPRGVQALARRLRLLALEVFFLGTAMGWSSGAVRSARATGASAQPGDASGRSSCAEHVQGRPPGIAGRGRRPSSSTEPSSAARAGNASGAGPRQSGPAQRGQRQVQEHGVPHHGLEVDVVALDRVGLARRRAGPRRPPDSSTSLEPTDLVEAAPALGHPGGPDGAGERDGALDRLEDAVELDLGALGHARRGDREVRQGAATCTARWVPGRRRSSVTPISRGERATAASAESWSKTAGARRAVVRRAGPSPTAGTSPVASEPCSFARPAPTIFMRALEHDLEAGQLLVAEVLALVA